MVKTIDTYPKKDSLIDAEKNIKLQKVLWKNETHNLIKENFEKYKMLEKKIHVLSETRTELLNLKRKLSWTPEEKADKLLEIIEKKENSTEYKVETEIKNNKEKVKKELRKKAEKEIPIIGWFLFDFVSNIKTKDDDSFFWAILRYIKSGILSWLWIENLEEQLEKVKLSKEQIKETKNKIKEYLIEKLNLNWKDEEIEKILNNENIFTSEKLISYYKQIKSWNWFSSNDLMKDFWNIWNVKDVLKENLKKLDKKAFEKISEFLFNTYWTKLDIEKQNNLKLLISEYITKWNLSTDKLNEIFNNKSFKIADLYPLLGGWIMFMFELVWKWIINTVDLWWNLVKSWWNIINISSYSLGFSENIEVDSLIEKLNKMSDEEKALFIWILYRKWGLFLNILWNITATTTRIWLDIVLWANSWVDWLKIFKDWILKWPAQQLRNISKIEKAITWVADNMYITKIQENMKMVEKNYKMMSIISNSKNIDGFKKQLNWKNWNFIKSYFSKDFDFSKYTDLDEISKAASKRVWTGFTDDFEIKFEKWKNHYIKEKSFGFWKSASMQKLNRAIWDVAKNQQNVLDKWFWVFSKFRETLSASKISHLSDKLVFEFETKKWAKTFFKQMNVLAQSSPELIKWIFNKLPIISVVWLAASWDEDFTKSLLKESIYLIPIIWPIWIIWEWGISWNDWNPKIDNPENILLWWGLLTLDWYLWIQAIKSWKFIKFMWRPALDLLDIWKWTAEFIQKWYKTIRAWGKFWWLSKEVLKKAKYLPKKIKILTIIAAVALLWINHATADDALEYSYWNKDWNIDYEKAKNDIEKMDNDEKIQFIKSFFVKEVRDMEFNLNWDILNIKTNTSELKSDYFITNKIKTQLNILFWVKEFNVK